MKTFNRRFRDPIKIRTLLVWPNCQNPKTGLALGGGVAGLKITMSEGLIRALSDL